VEDPVLTQPMPSIYRRRDLPDHTERVSVTRVEDNCRFHVHSKAVLGQVSGADHRCGRPIIPHDMCYLRVKFGPGERDYRQTSGFPIHYTQRTLDVLGDKASAVGAED